jgi:hypothetical protein
MQWRGNQNQERDNCQDRERDSERDHSYAEKDALE